MTNFQSTVVTIDSEEWRKLVSSGADEIGVDVTSSQMNRLIRFGQTLLEWNRKINLTSITDAGEMAVKHFIDSMAALPYIPDTGQLLDIGSGAGFPGLVINIFKPSLEITSIDSVRKKISFQQNVIRTLGLKKVRALHTRAEALPGENSRYDIIVSRALGSLDMFAGLALPMLAEDGRVIAYKGRIDKTGTDEIKTLKSKCPELTVDIHRYQLPMSGDSRSLVLIKQTEKMT